MPGEENNTATVDRESVIDGAQPSSLDLPDDGDEGAEEPQLHDDVSADDPENPGDDDVQPDNPDESEGGGEPQQDTEKEQLRQEIESLRRQLQGAQPTQQPKNDAPQSAYDADPELAKTTPEQRALNNKLVQAALRELGITTAIGQTRQDIVGFQAKAERAEFISEIGQKAWDETAPYMKEIASERTPDGRPAYVFTSHRQLYEIALGRKAMRERQNHARSVAEGATRKQETRRKLDVNSDTRPNSELPKRIPSQELKKMSMDEARARIAASLDLEDD